MKNKKLLCFCLLSLTAVITTSIIALSSHSLLSFGNADSVKYQLVMNKDKNKFHNTGGVTKVSGTSKVKTELNNDIEFTYNNIIGGGTSTWHVLSGDNGYFYNSDPINGITSLTLSFKTDSKTFDIYYADELEDIDDNVISYTSSTSNNIVCNFYGTNPAYFKMVNTSNANLSVSSMNLSFTCFDSFSNLTISSEDTNKGTVSGLTGKIRTGREVTLTATPNTYYNFAGWYEGSSLISDKAIYTFSMPYGNHHYQARFTVEKFNVSINYNSEEGTAIGAGSYDYKSNVTLTATPNIGYTFKGWYNNTTLLSKDATYSFTMPSNDVSYSALFAKLYNLTVYSEDESKGTVKYVSHVGGGMETTIEAVPNDGYALDYWFDDDFNELSKDPIYTFEMPNKDYVIYGSFASGGYKLTLESEDESLGIVEGANNYLPDRTVTIKCILVGERMFKGWYDSNDLLVSQSNIYSFTMPEDDYYLEAKFMTEEEEELWKKAHGIIPTISQDGKSLTYGMYPQSNVNDSSLLSTLNTLTNPNEYGYYFYENEYYYKYAATPYESGYTFDNGTTIVSGASYWFKVEPIKWKILDNEDGTYFITTESLLVNHMYNDYSGTQSKTDYQGNTATVYANNYKYSDIRSWLNTDFYNQAFFLDNDNIKVSTVDNSVASTGYSSNPYACEDTNDKLFLLSAKELTTAKYGFDTSTSTYDTARQCKTTDYARAHGAYAYSSSSYKNNGYYYTRSPYYYNSDYARYVNYDGYVGDRYYVDVSDYGVRLALRLTL